MASPVSPTVITTPLPTPPASDLWWAGYWAGFWTLFWIALVLIAIAVTAYLLGRSERVGWWIHAKASWHPKRELAERKP